MNAIVNKIVNLQLQHTYLVHTGTHSTCMYMWSFRTCNTTRSEWKTHEFRRVLSSVLLLSSLNTPIQTGLNLAAFAALHSLTDHFQITQQLHSIWFLYIFLGEIPSGKLT